jgi:hypothetical protein
LVLLPLAWKSLLASVSGVAESGAVSKPAARLRRNALFIGVTCVR